VGGDCFNFDPNGIATYIQSEHTGPSSEMPHYGLLAPNADPNFGEPQWTWVLGGKEYKDKTGSGSRVGVKAFTSCNDACRDEAAGACGKFTDAPIVDIPHGGPGQTNTAIKTPDSCSN
jgi:hypothetical protein